MRRHVARTWTTFCVLVRRFRSILYFFLCVCGVAPRVYPLVFLLLGLSEDSRVFGLDSLPPQPDHCDLLLDAMDAQLGQLQVAECALVCPCGRHFSQRLKVVCLQVWTHSSSKGAGVGPATQTLDTPVFRLGLTHARIMKSTSGNIFTSHIQTREILKELWRVAAELQNNILMYGLYKRCDENQEQKKSQSCCQRLMMVTVVTTHLCFSLPDSNLNRISWQKCSVGSNRQKKKKNFNYNVCIVNCVKIWKKIGCIGTINTLGERR